MTKQEVIKLVTLIVMSYPSSEKFRDEATLQGMTSVWARFFKDDDPETVALAVQRHIATRRFPPSISEIREQMVTIQHPELLAPDQAWEKVTDRRSTESEWGYTEYAEDALPPMIARAVHTIGWCDLWEREDRAKQTFLEQYRPAYERAREQAMLPQALRLPEGAKNEALGVGNHEAVT